MPPLTVDPTALDGAGATLVDIGKDIGLTMSTLSGTLSGCTSMCGNDPVGAAIGQRYDSSAAAVVQAIAAARNGLVNLGDGVRVSAHNYSLADAQSDVSGRTQPLPVPAASGKIAASPPPSSVGAGDAAPAGFGWVAKYIGMIWPNGDSARLRAAAAAWTVAGTQLRVTEAAAAGSLGIVGAQQIPEAEAMGRAFQASITGAVQVMQQCTSMAAQLTAYAAKIDAVHAAIIDLLSRICDPMTGFKEVWDVLTGEDEDEIKQIADDIKTVVDNFQAETSALATEMSAAMAAAENVASAMTKYADKEWSQFLHGTDVGRYVDTQLRFDKGVLAQAGGLIKDNWKYGPLRAMTQPERWFEDWKNTVTGMAPLVGLGGDGTPGVGESWKQVGKEVSHWDLWSKDPAEAAGRTAFDIGTLFAPGGGVGAAGKATHGAAEAAEAAGRAAGDVAKGAEAAVPRVGGVHPPEVPAGGAPRPLPEGAGKPVADESPRAAVPASGETKSALVEGHGAAGPTERAEGSVAAKSEVSAGRSADLGPGHEVARPGRSEAADQGSGHQYDQVQTNDAPSDDGHARVLLPEEIPPPFVRDVPYETGGIQPRYVGEQYPGGPMGWPGVTYVDDAARDGYRLTVHDGLLYDSQGNPFDTIDGKSAFGRDSDGRAIFVMDRDGNLYASIFQEYRVFHHSSLLAGRDVAAAGEMLVRDGRIELLTDRSGHYMPGRERTQQVLDQLASQGIVVDPQGIQFFAPDGS